MLRMDFGVTGYTVTGVNGTVASALFTVYVQEITSGSDANATPSVSYTKGSLTDRYGNPLASIPTLQSIDKVAPLIVSAVGVGTSLTVTFGEPVTNTTHQPLSVSDVTYNSNGTSGQNGLSAIVDADGSDGVVSFTMIRAFTTGDFSTDTISAKATVIDKAGNPSVASVQIAILPGVPIPVDNNAQLLSQDAIIGIGAGAGGLVVLIVAAILVVLCRRRGYCAKKNAPYEQDNVTNEFDFGSSGTEMTQSSRGVQRLEA